MATQVKSLGRGGASGSGVSIQWKPDLSQFGEAIQDLRDPIYNAVYRRLGEFVPILRQHAHDTARWTNRTGIARSGLFAYRRRGKSFMTLALAHGPRTIASYEGNARPWRGAPFYYGIALETFLYGGGGLSVNQLREMGLGQGAIDMIASGRGQSFHTVDSGGHGTYAVIMPTMEAHYQVIMKAFGGVLYEALGSQGVV
jgi:hypothetical protein